MRWRRLRTWAKWACAVAAFVFVSALAASEWTYVDLLSADYRTRVSLTDGAVSWVRYQSGQGLWRDPFSGLTVRLMPPGHKLKVWIKPYWDFASVISHVLVMPLWIPSMVSFVAATAMWWPDHVASRRRRAG